MNRREINPSPAPVAVQRVKKKHNSPETTEKYTRLLEHLPAMVFELSPAGELLTVNEAAIDITGYTPEELFGENFQHLLFPGEQGRQLDELYELVQSGDVKRYTLRLTARGGGLVILEINTANVYNAKGELQLITGIGIDSTLRQRAEKDLYESEARFRSLANSTSAAIFIIDEGRILYANPAASTITEFPDEELLGKPFFQLIAPNGKNGSNEDLDSNSLFETYSPRSEVKTLTKIGEERWLDLTIDTVKFSGHPAWLVTAFDITQRRLAEEARFRAEESLRKQTGLLQSILDSMSEAVVVADETGRMVLFNPAAEKLYNKGIQEHAVQDRSELYGIYLPDKTTLYPWHELPLVRALLGDKVDAVEMFIHPPGSDRSSWVISSSRPLINEKGQLKGGVAVFRDITNRRQAEEQVRNSEALFHAVFNQARLGIKLVDIAGRIIRTNPALQEMLGYSADELRQMTYQEITHPEDREVSQALFDNLISGQRDYFNIEKRYVSKAGDIIWAHLNMSLLRDTEANPLYEIGLVENITSAKQLEAELSEVQRQLMESSENERIHLAQELHDGPIQDLIGTSFQINLLNQNVQDPLGSQRLLDLQSTLQEVIRSLRAICGELRPPTLAPFGLEKAIRSHADGVRQRHPELELALDLAQDKQELPERVRLALFRIYQQSMMNVIRHSHARNVFVRFALDSDQIELDIRDDGQGFEVPKRWIEEVRQGHFGLVGAAERAQAIGGQLKIISNPLQGTIIRVIVPRKDCCPDITGNKLSF